MNWNSFFWLDRIIIVRIMKSRFPKVPLDCLFILHIEYSFEPIKFEIPWPISIQMMMQQHFRINHWISINSKPYWSDCAWQPIELGHFFEHFWIVQILKYQIRTFWYIWPFYLFYVFYSIAVSFNILLPVSILEFSSFKRISSPCAFFDY